MSHQNKPMNTSTPSLADLPVKRKRGRPRKDENLVKKENSHRIVTPATDGTRKIQNVKENSIQNVVKVNSSNNIDEDMVGRAVSGVIEGTFDAGYFLSVKATNSSTLLRGAVFQPGQYTPVSAANDIAPRAKMYNRREFPIPNFNPQTHQLENQTDQILSGALFAHNNQSATVMVPLTNMPKNDSSASLGGKITMQQNQESGFGNQPAASLKNLRMVEQNELMQVFEVSTQLGGAKIDEATTKDVISESGSEPMVDILLGSETIDQAPQDQNPIVECGLEPTSELVHKEPKSPNPLIAKLQSVECGLKPTELVHSEVAKVESAESGIRPSGLIQNEPKSLNLQLHQTPIVVKPESMPAESISEPMEIVTEKSISSKDDIQSVLAVKVLMNDETCHNGNAVVQPGDNNEVGSQSTPRTEEVTPSKPDIPPCSSSGHNNTEVDFVLGDAIPTTQSHCYQSYFSETENK